MKLIARCSLLVAIACLPAIAQDKPAEMPKQSLEMLQDVFGRVTDILWEESDEYFHQGYYNRSVATLRLITEMDPTDVQAFEDGSWLLDSSGLEAEGIAYLEIGLALNPDRSDLYAELGWRYLHMEKWDKSADYYEKAIKFPDCPLGARHMLAHAYEKGGKLDKAVETWEACEKLEPGSAVVTNNLDRVRKLMQDGVKTP
jgi:tetratricopeptide (TPR) repeat protein